MTVTTIVVCIVYELVRLDSFSLGCLNVGVCLSSS